MPPPQWPLSQIPPMKTNTTTPTKTMPSTPKALLPIIVHSPASAGSRGTKRLISPPSSPGSAATEMPNKMRKVTAAISIPRLRSARSRNVSAATTVHLSSLSSSSTPSSVTQHKEPKKLGRRTVSTATISAPIRVVHVGAASANVPEQGYVSSSSNSRVLRSSKNGSLNGKGGGVVMYPANAKKWSEDGENFTPWRGLRSLASFYME